MMKQNDTGQDLQTGDVVWIKGIIESNPSKVGDAKVRYFARPGFDEYARSSINAIFLKRSRLNILRRFWRYLRGNKKEV